MKKLLTIAAILCSTAAFAKPGYMVELQQSPMGLGDSSVGIIGFNSEGKALTQMHSGNYINAPYMNERSSYIDNSDDVTVTPNMLHSHQPMNRHRPQIDGITMKPCAMFGGIQCNTFNSNVPIIRGGLR